MNYNFKKCISLVDGKKVYVHAFSYGKILPLISGFPICVESSSELENLIEIAKKDGCKYLSLYNLNQRDFEKIIHEFKKNLIDLIYINFEPHQTLDLKCLKLAKKLKRVKVEYGNHKLKLWNMRFNHRLEEVVIANCKELLNQKGLEKAKVKKLTIRRYSNGAPDTNELLIKDFNVFNTMPNLEYLNLFVKKKKNKVDDLIALSKLKNIKVIKLPKNYFFFSQFAWLSGKLENVKGIGCYQIEYDHANEMDSYIINGSRMCWYVRGFEKAKLNKYKKKFSMLVEKYKNDSNPPLK